MYLACTKGITSKAPQAPPDTDMDTERKGQAGHLYWQEVNEVQRAQHAARCQLFETMRYNMHSMLLAAIFSLPKLHADCSLSVCCDL